MTDSTAFNNENDRLFNKFSKIEQQLISLLLEKFGYEEVISLHGNEVHKSDSSIFVNWENEESSIRCIRFSEFGRQWVEHKIDSILSNENNEFSDEFIQKIKNINSEKIKLRNELTVLNLKFANVMASKYRRRNNLLRHDDLIQEATIGVMKAVERFDPEIGAKFSTYATWWIKHRLKYAIVSGSQMIKTPHGVYDLDLSIRKFVLDFVGKQGRNPTNEEISVGMKVPQYKIEAIKSFRNNHCITWMDAGVGVGDGEMDMHELIASTSFESSEDILLKNSMKEEINKILLSLSPKERSIIEMRYGINRKESMSLAEVGEVFKLSRERIRQLEARILKSLKMSKSFKKNTLDDCVN